MISSTIVQYWWVIKASIMLAAYPLINRSSIIYLSRVLCLCVCLSVCHNCGTLSYSFSFSNQTDQGDETEGLEREGLKMER
jgi:hypothetical protein